MAPTLNIAALANRTGVPADTIRKWEQRYGVLRPERTTGGQRRYSELDVARVEWLKARLADGYRIGEAATLLGSAALAVAHPGEDLRAAMLESVERSDLPSLVALVEQAFALHPLDEALADVLAPTLVEVGDRWQRGQLSVGQEHLASAVVRAQLEKLLTDVRSGVRGTAVLACAPGERHELGLLMLAVLLRADGWQVAYLGADTPVGDAVRLAEQVDARVLCLSAAMSDRFGDLARALGEADVPPKLEVMLGGAAVTKERAAKLGARYSNGDLRSSVRAIRKLAS